MSLLQIRGLSKRFGGLMAVNEVSFTVAAGQIYSVIGPNGAGKSTLFKLITGFERPSAGRVVLRDTDITALPPYAVARAGAVRTFQENAIFADMTPREAVRLAQHKHARTGILADFLRLRRARAEAVAFQAKTDDILFATGLADVADRPASGLPHGHLRALGIAVALATQPALLLLDEPLAGLNPEETSRGMDLIRELRRRGLTILLVEHDMRAVMAISDRILVLNFGTPIVEGPPERIQTDERVIEAYLGLKDSELDL